MPDSAFSIVTDDPAELSILRMLILVGLSLLAVLPWVRTAGDDVRRRNRRWTIPGIVASTVYLISANPVYLIAGFCLLVGASLDMWVTRAHLASDSLRVRLSRRDRHR